MFLFNIQKIKNESISYFIIRYRLLCKPNIIENKYLWCPCDALTKFSGTVQAFRRIFRFINHTIKNCNYSFLDI